MARPVKYDWDSIDSAYQNGVIVDDICDRYSVDKKTLQNRISSKKLEVITGNINALSAELKDVLGNITGMAGNDPIMNGIITERINTALKDNKIIQNNRDLALAFQGLISDGFKDGIYQSPQDINAGINSIKGIESIANPQASKQDITVNTAIQTNIAPKTIDDFYDV